MIKIIMLLFIIHYSLLIGKAQVTQEWVATYSGTGSGFNFPKKMAIYNHGDIIVAGNSDSTNGYDYIVLKYSPWGNLIWKQRYNGIGNNYDYLSGMVLDDSGNVYVTGSSEEGATYGGINWVTIKYNSDGVMKWKRSMNWTGNRTDETFGMNIDEDRNILIVGYGKPTSSSGPRQMLTAKYSCYGDSLWIVAYKTSPSTHDWGYSVVTDDSNNVYSSGYGIIPTGNEIVTIKYSSGGNEKWVKTVPTNEGDYLRPTFSAVDNSNNIVVVGYGYFSNNYDFQTLKYSSSGDLIWSRYYAGISDDYAHCLTMDNENNILIGGSAYSTGFSDYLILEYSPEGDTILNKIIDGGGQLTDQVNSIAIDTVNNIYVTGFSKRISGISNYLTIKLSFLGEIVWSREYITSFNNVAFCLNLDRNENIYVSGGCENAGGGEIVTLKYSQLTGMTINNTNESEYLLINFPNPFNSSTEIKYKIKNYGLVRINIYDIQGKEIETLVNEKKNNGNYKINFNGEKYSSGIYFYSLQVDNIIIQTNRMVIIK